VIFSILEKGYIQGFEFASGFSVMVNNSLCDPVIMRSGLCYTIILNPTK
jgi:hypothetical protein